MGTELHRVLRGSTELTEWFLGFEAGADGVYGKVGWRGVMVFMAAVLWFWAKMAQPGCGVQRVRVFVWRG